MNNLPVLSLRFWFSGLAGLTLLAGLACGGGGSKAGAPSATVGFSPVSGAPGTRVVLTGSGFVASDQVLFANTRAETQISTDGTQLTAWVPYDPALWTGLTPQVHLRTASGTFLASNPFTVLAPRLNLLGGAFVREDGRDPFPPLPYRIFDFPTRRRTAQYALQLPQVPILHPYHPGFNTRPGMAVPRTTLNLQLSGAFVAALPATVLEQLRVAGIGPDALDIFCVSQNQPWTNAVPYEFRPHYWTDPNAPYNQTTGPYSTSSAIRVGVFETDGNVTLPGGNNPGLFATSITVHPDAAGFMVSSPDSMRMTGLDFNDTHTFWSLVVDGARAAATLHLVLNDPDQGVLQGIMEAQNPTSIDDLATGLNRSHFSTDRIAVQTAAMFRPLITRAVLGPDSAGTDPTLTLTGSGFTGPLPAVTVGTNDVVAQNLQVLDDSTLAVTIPRATAVEGNIRVHSDYGASDPAALD